MAKKRKKLKRTTKTTILKKKSNISNEGKKKTFLEKGFVFFRNLPKRIYILILVINFFVGLDILIYSNTLKIFFPHLLCLTITISITLQIGKEYLDTLKILDKELSKKHPKENTEVRILFEKYYANAMNSANLLACIVIVTVFLWAIFSQLYISLNIVGYYAVFMVCVSVSLSVIGYAQYLWILWFLFRIGKCSSIYYNEIAPANTPFIMEIAKLLQKVKWCFFIEGFFYTFEYFILIPKGNIDSTKISMPDNFSFLLTWIIILLVIVLAFPLLVFLQEYLLTQIIDNWKRRRIEYLSTQYEYLSKITSIENMSFQTYMYQEIINKINNSADYPLKIKRIGPMIVSIATVCLHMVSLLSQLSDVKNFFNL